jgi:hypothetical protein
MARVGATSCGLVTVALLIRRGSAATAGPTDHPRPTPIDTLVGNTRTPGKRRRATCSSSYQRALAAPPRLAEVAWAVTTTSSTTTTTTI